MFPHKFEFHVEYFDKIMGSLAVRKAIEKDTEILEIVKNYATESEAFAKVRNAYLLY
jgi:uncharacterized protein YbbC (DUF1343 family)